jgi:hypothetical protein
VCLVLAWPNTDQGYPFVREAVIDVDGARHDEDFTPFLWDGPGAKVRYKAVRVFIKDDQERHEADLEIPIGDHAMTAKAVYDGNNKVSWTLGAENCADMSFAEGPENVGDAKRNSEDGLIGGKIKGAIAYVVGVGVGHDNVSGGEGHCPSALRYVLP